MTRFSTFAIGCGFAALILFACARAEARTTEQSTSVPAIPGGLHHVPTATAVNTLIHNSADLLSQAQRDAADQQAWQKSLATYMQQLTESEIMNANRDARYATAQQHWRDNLRPMSRFAEYAALSLVATRAHTEVLPIYERLKLQQYEGAADTAPDSSTPLIGLREAVAEACDAGCVSPEEAQVFTSGGIPCHSDPTVAGSWEDPGKLKKLVETQGCIDAAPASKASRCEAAFAHMMNLGQDMPRSYRLSSSDNPGDGIRAAIDAMLRKAAAQNITQCKLAELRRDTCLPKSAVSNPDQYDQKTKAAKQFGIDCARLQGNLPSQRCDEAQTMALFKGAMTQIPSEGNVAGKDINLTAGPLMGAAQVARQAAMADGAQPCDLGAVAEHFKEIRAFLDSPAVRTYMASKEFVREVNARIAQLPEKHLDPTAGQLFMRLFQDDVRRYWHRHN